MIWYKELDNEQLVYDYEERHYLLALTLALFFYILFLAFIFLEIPTPLSQIPKKIIPLGNDLLDHLPRRTNPARVVSMPAPSKRIAPTPTTPQKANSPAAPLPPKKDLTPPKKTGIKEPIIKKSLFNPTPTTPTSMPDQAPIHELTNTNADDTSNGPIPVNYNRKGETQSIPQEISGSAELPTEPTQKLPPRRGRGSWFKQNTITEPQADHTNTNQINTDQTNRTTNNNGGNQAFRQLEDISAKQVSMLPVNEDGEGDVPVYGSPLGMKGAMPPELAAHKMEFEVFATRLVHTICDASRQQPLYMGHTPMTNHTTTLVITVDRNRKIHAIKITNPSPHKALNEYLERIIYAIFAPKLPAWWQKDTLSMTLSVTMHSSPAGGEIWLIPAGGN